MSRQWLTPLTPVYRAALTAKNAAYQLGGLKAQRLNWPVISVGNLSVGGSGKTPLTIRLAELIAADGFAVDVLSRGYGRKSRATERVDWAGSAERFGDEPLLIARRSGMPVFVGASRYAAGLLAEKISSKGSENGNSESPRAVHLLDDGFQHRQLAREVDVVVLHRTDFSERLLPAGQLREPLSALTRADFIAMRVEDSDLELTLRQHGIHAPIWWMQRSLCLPNDLTSTTERVVAFCGIARPGEFFSALIAKDVNLELTVTFADHHAYSREDMERLAKVASEAQADAFAITEKDSVKLDASLLAILETAAPVRVARLEVSLQDEPEVLRQLKERLIAR